MRVRISNPHLGTGVMALTVSVVLAASLATATTAEAVTPGKRVVSAQQSRQIAWSTPAVVAKHAKIKNSVEGKDAATVIILNDAAAPTRYDFTLKLPAGASAHLASDGTVAVLDQQANPLGSFQAPWAKDATGKSLDTKYALAGSILTQTVDTDGAAFPVIADPHYTWGWISGTVYFNRSETLRIARSSSAAALGGLARFPFGALFTLFYYVIRSQASQAYGLGGCYKLSSKFSGGSSPWDRYTYFGGYCT